MGLVAEDYANYFRQNEPFYTRLEEEVKFILGDLVKGIGVKSHSISGRVKDLEHALEKIERKGYANPSVEIEDVVGCRVVCLFMSDLDKVEAAIRKEFKVCKSEDKVEGVGGNKDAFGYMSRHYICELQPKHSGARYDSLKGIKFELQVRTILMDAWANVSHYLAYKGEASIPAHLRRDFHALSGLFYVADKHFELFFNEAAMEEKNAIAQAESGELDEQPISLETVEALLAQTYPERRQAESVHVSELIEDVTHLGYTEISQLKQALVRGSNAAYRMEEEGPGVVLDSSSGKILRGKGRFNSIGIARYALALADDRYEKLKYNKDAHLWAKYRAFLSE